MSESSETSITASIKLKNGRLISEKNIDKIYASSNRECESTYDKNGLVKGYFEKWRVRKEPEGYIFREVRFNSGINGHHRSLRRLIVSTLISASPHITIHVEK